MATTAALLLCVGESSRLGGAPEALMSLGGSTAVSRLVDLCLSRDLDPVTVVVGPHRGPIAHELRGRPVELVDSELWYEGETASVRAGVESIPPDRDILFWSIDHPFSSGSTVDRLLKTRDEDALAVWFIPTYGGRGGHPVLWRSNVRGDLLELRNDAPVPSLIPEFGVQVRRVEVDDPGVVAMANTLEGYRVARDDWGARAGL